MADGRSLRHKERITYEISDDSEAGGSPSAVSSAFSSPQKTKRVRKLIDLEEDDELEELEAKKTPPPRISSAGHALRQHTVLSLSLRARQNGDKPKHKKRKVLKTVNREHQGISSNAPSNVPRSARTEIRDTIATETAAKRATYFIAQKEFFLPLLPENNHVSKLVEQRRQVNSEEDASIAPYEAFTKQPDG